jgi:hypothetical protein
VDAGCAYTSNSFPENNDPRLYGKWQSDLKKTMDFNSQYAKLTEGQMTAFKKMFGKLIVEYSENGTIKSFFPEYDNPDELSVDENQYTVIAKDSERVIITDNSHLKEDAIFKEELLEVIHFTDCACEDDDKAYTATNLCDCCKTYWIYINKHPIFRSENMHIREYFTKIE